MDVTNRVSFSSYCFPLLSLCYLARCAGGFTSSIRCSNDQQCPPGLFCDSAINLCCPLLLPLTEEHVTNNNGNNNNDINNNNANEQRKRLPYPQYVATSNYPSPDDISAFVNNYVQKNFPTPPYSNNNNRFPNFPKNNYGQYPRNQSFILS